MNADFAFVSENQRFLRPKYKPRKYETFHP